MELFEIICNFLLVIAGFSAVGIYLSQKKDEKKRNKKSNKKI